MLVGLPGWARISSSTLLSSAAAFRRRSSVESRSVMDFDSSKPVAFASLASASGKSSWIVMLIQLRWPREIGANRTSDSFTQIRTRLLSLAPEQANTGGRPRTNGEARDEALAKRAAG